MQETTTGEAHRKVRKSHKATVLLKKTSKALSKQREQEAMEELDRAIAQARLQGLQATNLPTDTDTLTKRNEKNLEVSDEKRK